MDDLNYSRRNCPYFKTTSKDLENRLSRIVIGYEEYRNEIGLKSFSEKDRNLYKRHFEIVLLDLYSAWLSDPQKYIGYNRGHSAFIKSGTYWHPKYEKSLLSKTAFRAVIDYLGERGFLENHITKRGYGGFSSRMRATPLLAQAMSALGVNSATIAIGSDAPVILVKSKKKKILPYPDTNDFNIDNAEKNLKRINQHLESTYINLNISDEAYFSLLKRMSDNDTEMYREPIEFNNRSLKRIFRDDFSKGGRFYGGWWQGVPSELRKFIVIDGAMTREMDYSTIQPRIMYADVGVTPPKDAYMPEGWPVEVRPIAKKAFNQIINSDKSSRNKKQWHRFGPNIDPERKPDNWESLEKFQKNVIRRKCFEENFGRPYFDLLDDLMSMHEPIDQFLFSGAWGEMQRIDSDIAEQVLVRLLDQDVPVTALPIHDSFIVRRGSEDALFSTMAEAFEYIVGKPCEIDLDDAVYDIPENYKGPRLVGINDMVDEVMNEIKSKKEYNKREIEWQRAHGPVDV